MKTSTISLGRRVSSLFLSAAMLTAGLAGLNALSAPQPVKAAETTQYELAGSTQEGVILHAWQWSFNNIKNHMQEIAAAGYTSVQTSVIQQAKESTLGADNSVWWVYYQPCKFEIDNTGHSALGTKAEFTAMCTEAHKYGIHVIVDVVSNHLGNETAYDLSSAIPDDIRNDPDCWHAEGFANINYNSRYSITHGSMGGLPDLNTENTKIQNYVANYLKECIDCGADGFRFDAAKHISVPIEGSEYTFWPTVIGAAEEYYQTKGTYDSLYCYGEILGGTNGPSITGYTQYMHVTDDSTGNGIRGNVVGHNASAAATASYNLNAGAANSVLWAESHDTYSGDDMITTNISTSDINKTWALVASRNQATALYFARTQGYRTGQIGAIGSTECFSTEVAAVNNFHNQYAGQSEYLSSSGNIAYNERGTTGVVLVNVNGGSASVNVTAHKMAAGTYEDKITGSTFTVANGKITGTIGSTGIAVVSPEFTPHFSVTPASGTVFTDSLSLTLKAISLTNTTYRTTEGASGSFTSGDKIVIGAASDPGTPIAVTLTGQNGSETVTQTYNYYKKDPTGLVTIYFDNTSYGWNQVYAYIYASSGNQVVENHAWPGELMTYNADSGLYEMVLTDTFQYGNVIFTEASDASANRYPAHEEPGLAIGGVSMIFGENHTWETYIPTITPLTNTSSLASEQIALGTAATVTASATGGSGEYTFAVDYRKAGKQTWTSVQAYSSNTSVSVKPTYASAYEIRVRAKDSAGAIDEKILTVTVTASSSTDLSNLSTLSAEKIAFGKSVTVTCASSGGTGTKTYAVYFKKPSSTTWTLQQAYSTNTSVTFKPSSACVYEIQIKAKDQSGNVAKLVYKLPVTASENSTLTNNSIVSPMKTAAGSKVNITCAASGGTGTKTFTVCYKKTSSSKWTTVQYYTTNKNVTLTFQTAGSYNVCVKAKDSTGAMAKSYVTVTVT